jgi:radical SAM protein with 4Fe4S-binding SPASM domain
MVETLHKDFPQVKSAAFEAVLSRELFETIEDQTVFYKDFVNNFFQAKKLGECYGIDICNTVFNSVGCCKLRACPGKLVITPDGILSACSRISSVKEPHYNLFKYGYIDSDKVTVDENKYNWLMNQNALLFKECSNCIAQWHCGGGCLLARKVLAERMPAYCGFMRQMVIETLKLLTR